METFPISITELLDLRYLNLSRTLIQELPKELGKLVKLNYLDLLNMMHLKKIPSGVIGSLLELRVLNLYGSYEVVDWDFEEVYKLRHLNDFGISVDTQHCTLKKLLSSSNKNLQMFTRHLHLFSSSPSSILSTITVEVDSTIKSPEILELFSNLEFLSFGCLPGAELMNMNMQVWRQQQHLDSSWFQNLIQIAISDCNGLKDLTWVGYVPNLKTLKVESCKEFEEIIGMVVDDSGETRGDEISTMMMNMADIFKRLETLNLFHLRKLKSICWKALGFPCLESIHVILCPQLKKLPFDSGSNVNNTLQKIVIVGGPKWWTESQWEEDHDNEVKSKFLPYFIGIRQSRGQ